ncbi:hypothetical protein L596_007897 [Steinernema carpocapsae]|uniref:Uncharacterized protein n=1 Tax=Steinernema carpocapsae TaxID=34508 RepID=A0A4U5PAS5_STECR|nr:hypothetical protein L596_007897 [Steinernema carpocapsae]
MVVAEVTVFTALIVVLTVFVIGICAKKQSAKPAQLETMAKESTKATNKGPSKSLGGEKSARNEESKESKGVLDASVIPDKTLTCETDPDLQTKSNYNMNSKTAAE